MWEEADRACMYFYKPQKETAKYIFPSEGHSQNQKFFLFVYQ